MFAMTQRLPPLTMWKVVVLPAFVNLAVALALGLAPGSIMAKPAQAGDVEPVRIVAFGDSLTAGYLLSPDDAFPHQLAVGLKARGHAVEIINAGVSGDTTAGGLQRLDWSVPDGTEAVILELGANDALRGMPPEEARDNLDAIVTRLKARGIEVLIAGMQAPKNWGEDYRQAFDLIFRELSTRHDTLLYPFFLDGVALDPALNLDDGLHPNAKGVARIVERILPVVEELIARVTARRAKLQSKS
jgi:acyl-CoA thioesterase-1